MTDRYLIEMGPALLALVQQLTLGRQAEVDARFAAFEERWRNDETHRAAQTQMASPSGASTPLPQAVQRAEARVYDARAQAFEAVNAALAAFLSFRHLEEQAAHKRDRLAAFHAEKEAGLAEHERVFLRDLRKHDVHPWHLDQLSKPAKAVLADLIRWYHFDTRFENPDNPWAAIDELYANRTVKTAGNRCGNSDARSTAAPAPPYRHPHVPDIYYRYGREGGLRAEASSIAPVGASAEIPDRVESEMAAALPVAAPHRWDTIGAQELHYDIIERTPENEDERRALGMKLPEVTTLHELALPRGVERSMADSADEFGDIQLGNKLLAAWSQRTGTRLTDQEKRAWVFLLVALRNPQRASRRDAERQFDGLVIPGPSGRATVREIRRRSEN